MFKQKIAGLKNKIKLKLVIWGAIGVAAAVVLYFFMTILIVCVMGGGSIVGECNTNEGTIGSVEGKVVVNESIKTGQKAMLNIANAVSAKTEISARLLYSQLAQEAGSNGDSSEAKVDKNFGGITYYTGCPYPEGQSRPKNEGGSYVKFPSLSAFATMWAKIVSNNFKKMNLGKSATVADYSHAMKKAGYYTASESSYTAGMEAQAKIYDSLKSGKTKASSGSGGGDDNSDSTSPYCETDSELNGSWGWPFKGTTYSYVLAHVIGVQRFGQTRGSDKDGFHDGVDFGTIPWNNKNILAIHSGVVTKIGFEGHTQYDLGGYVVVHNKKDGYNVIYQEFLFNKSDRGVIKVHVGQNIKTGDVIGYLSDKTSSVTHVHIGITKEPFYTAVGNSYSLKGGWKNPITLIHEGMKKGSSGGGSDDSSSNSGLSKSEYEAREWIVTRESRSSGGYNARNGIYIGRYQLTNTYLHGDYSPKNQDKVANEYVKSRYGSWVNAKKFWQANGWY